MYAHKTHTDLVIGSIFVQGADLLHQYVFNVREGPSIIYEFALRRRLHRSASDDCRIRFPRCVGSNNELRGRCCIIRRRSSVGRVVTDDSSNHQEDGQQQSCRVLHVTACPESNRTSSLNDKDALSLLRANCVRAD